jgi:hypothetical protein
VAALAAALLIVAACSDDDDGAVAVGDEPEAATVDTAPAETVAPTSTEVIVVDTTPTTLSTDEEQIRYAYETWILIDTPSDVRASLLEDGEEREAEIQAGFEEHEAIIHAATIEVDAVTLLDADHAEVVFRVLWGGRPSPYFPDPLTGTAVRDDGWRVTSETLCTLFAGALGGQCAAPGTGPSTTTAPAGPQPVVLWVTNQSFAEPAVDLVLSVDGQVVASQTYLVEGQHTVVEHALEVVPGEHTVVVETADGSARAELVVQVDDPEWVSVTYWGTDPPDPTEPIVLGHHEEQIFMD